MASFSRPITSNQGSHCNQQDTNTQIYILATLLVSSLFHQIPLHIIPLLLLLTPQLMVNFWCYLSAPLFLFIISSRHYFILLVSSQVQSHTSFLSYPIWQATRLVHLLYIWFFSVLGSLYWYLHSFRLIAWKQHQVQFDKQDSRIPASCGSIQSSMDEKHNQQYYKHLHLFKWWNKKKKNYTAVLIISNFTNGIG